MVETSEDFKTISISSLRKSVEDYFKKYGIEVDVDVSYRPHYSDTLVVVRPQWAYSLSIADELLLLDNPEDIVRTMVKNLFNEMVSSMCQVFNKYNRKIVPSIYINDWVLIYNPKKHDPDKFIRVLLPLEL